MQVGVLQFFGWRDRKIPREDGYARALERVRVMDETGYDAIWLAEHHFSGYSVCPSVHVMGSYVAARTQRLRIGTAVTLAAMQHPLRIAEEVALLDVLSGGRVNWGAGRGFDPVEFRVFEVPGEESAERFREAWREAILSHPLAYLAHRWHTFAIATGVTDLAGFYVTIPWDWTRVELHYPRHGLAVSWERSGFSLLVRSWLGAAVENLPGLFRSWRYLLLAGIGLVVCATRGARGRGWPVRSMLLLSSACLYSGTYFFAGGQTNLRFHLWSVTAVVLAAAFLVHELRAHPAGERDA